MEKRGKSINKREMMEDDVKSGGSSWREEYKEVGWLSEARKVKSNTSTLHSRERERERVFRGGEAKDHLYHGFLTFPLFLATFLHHLNFTHKLIHPQSY